MNWRRESMKRLLRYGLSCLILTLGCVACGSGREVSVPSGSEELVRAGIASEKAGSLVRALWFFERARLQYPRSEALQDKLEDLRLRLGLPIAAPPVAGQLHPSDWGVRLSLSEQWCLAILLQVIAIACLYWAWRCCRRNVRGPLLVQWPFLSAGLLLTASIAFTFWVSSNKEAESSRLMVIQSGVSMHSAPHHAAIGSQVIRAGSVISVREVSDRWLRIVYEGETGWIGREQAIFIPQ